MVTKRYEGDWAKSKARDLLVDIAQRTLLTYRKPQDLRVLCFPGIDAVEIFEVYDRLGIPRQNIVGIEKDRSIASTIEKKRLDIEIVNKSLEAYINDNPSIQFDIVSLDYTGPLSKQHLDTIRNIRVKQKRNQFLLHHTNLIKRDRDISFYANSYAMNFIFSSNNQEFLAIVGGLPGEKNPMVTASNRLNEIAQEQINGDSLKAMKVSSYLNALRTEFEGISPEDSEVIFRFYTGRRYLEFLSTLEKVISKECNINIKLTPNNILSSIPVEAIRIPKQLAMRYFSQRCNELGITDLRLQNSIYAFIDDITRKEKFFSLIDLEQYSYVSESGSPIVGFIGFLVYPEKVMSATADLAHSFGFPNELAISDHHLFFKNLREVSKRQHKLLPLERVDYLDKKEKDINYLGSSAKPVLTKQRAIESFKAGKSVDEVKLEFRGWSNKPLAQWKAHVTMGTYDTKTDEREEDKDLETITKEEALDLVQSGIPPKEINESYPTSFSVSQLATLQNDPTATITITKEEAIELLATGGVTPEDLIQAYPGTFTIGQLRAFKAHVTMGTYKASGK